MKLLCPHCQKQIDLDFLFQSDALERYQFGSDWPLVLEYLDLFKARQDGPMAAKKRLRLIREVWEIWSTGRFAFDGQEYQASPAQIRAALKAVCNRELSGLRNHNYLKIVLKGSQRKRSAGGDACPTGTPAPPGPQAPGKYAGRGGRQVVEVPDD